MTKGNDTLYFTYDASGIPVSVTHSNGSTSVTYYYVTNLQGDVMHLFDANGATAGYYTYDAWGNQISMGSSDICQLNPLRYRGYVYDQETELYYLQSRYYNPEWGRFINADAFVATGQGLVGNNMFAYCGNNPVSRIDVSGEFFNTICGTLVSGFVAAFTRSDKESFGQAFARGAVTGAIAGAALDISIATAGAGAIAIAAIGGATAAVLDYSWEQTNKAESINAGEIVLNATIGAGMKGQGDGSVVS